MRLRRRNGVRHRAREADGAIVKVYTVTTLRQIVDGRTLEAYGTSEGVKKEWDERERKAPYEMTQEEYHNWRSSNGFTSRNKNNNIHRAKVESALEGRTGSIVGVKPAIGKYRMDQYVRHADVPADVLKDYPDLRKKYGK